MWDPNRGEVILWYDGSGHMGDRIAGDQEVQIIPHKNRNI